MGIETILNTPEFSIRKSENTIEVFIKEPPVLQEFYSLLSQTRNVLEKCNPPNERESKIVFMPNPKVPIERVYVELQRIYERAKASVAEKYKR
jgi:hypothetical protein